MGLGNISNCLRLNQATLAQKWVLFIVCVFRARGKGSVTSSVDKSFPSDYYLGRGFLTVLKRIIRSFRSSLLNL